MIKKLESETYRCRQDRITRPLEWNPQWIDRCIGDLATTVRRQRYDPQLSTGHHFGTTRFTLLYYSSRSSSHLYRSRGLRARYELTERGKQCNVHAIIRAGLAYTCPRGT